MSSITEEASLGKLHDPAFKLFGRTIPVSSEGEYESASYQNACQEAPVSEDESSGPDVMRSDGQDQDLKRNPSPSRLPSASVVKEGSHDPTLETEVMVSSSSTYLPNDAPHEKIACEEEALKKPKNLIPCPRCESMDTKFCYFNNYNVNQPRHFCKNCQRYWTAGGNLRNVPIGAGRRKSKPSIPLNQSENIMVREDSPEDAKNLISCSGAPSLSQSTLFSRAHGAADSSSATTTILTFGQENPVLDARKPHVSHGFDGFQGYKQDISSTAHTKTNLNLNVDSARPIDNEKVINTNIYDGQNPDTKTTQNPAFWQHPQPFQDSSMEALDTNKVKESNGVESTGGKADAMPTCVSSVSFSYMPEQSRADAVPTCISNASFSHTPGPWAYAPNLAWGNFVTANAVMQGELSNSLGNTNLHHAIQSATQSPWASSADAAHCITQLPWASLTTHPQALNNIIAQPPPWTGSIGNPCSWPFVQHPLWWNSAWAMPLAAASIAAATDQPLGNNTLRKRQHDSIESDNEKSVPLFMPKTLRIDDPGSAAQSSIWTALGLQTRSDNVASTGMFRKIETKVKNEENNYTLKSNPAAMELSALFRESNLPL